MNDTKNEPAWPEKVWLDTIHCNDQSEPPKFYGAQNTIVHVTQPVNSFEYIRADLAQPQFTPEQLQSVLDALEIGKQYTGRDVRMSSMCANDKESSLYRAMDRVMSEAIALLKGMK